MSVPARLALVTLGVPDLPAARAFYVEGLGWDPVLEVEGEVTFVQLAHGVLLALWRADAMAEDVGAPVSSADAAVLSHNVGSEDEVLAFVDRAVAAGATVLKPPQATHFGGFHAYLADPGGFRWEVCHNPGLVFEPSGAARFLGA